MHYTVTTGITITVAQRFAIRSLDVEVPGTILGRTNLGNFLIWFWSGSTGSFIPQIEFRCSVIERTGNMSVAWEFTN